MHQSCRAVLLRTALLAGLTLGVSTARADLIAFSNLANFTDFGATHELASQQGSNIITSMVADDIVPIAGVAGLPVVEFAFTVVNFNTTTASFRPLVRFYDSDGPDGGPGTFLAAVDFGAVSVPADTGGILIAPRAADDAPYFILPAGMFWAGVIFDNDNGATGATAAQLDNIGQLLFDPPTIGTSSDMGFATFDAGTFVEDDPDGIFFDFFGDPPVNFGWEFTVIPEPSSLSLLMTAGLLLGGGVGAARCGGLSFRRRGT